MNRKTLFAALTCGLLIFSLLGCGTSNKLQSITLQASSINGVPVTTQSGFFSLQGNGGWIQLQAIGNYSSGKTFDLTKQATYNVIVDPAHGVDAFGNALLPPCQAPCQVSGQGTAEYSVTGLITAVEPATCTWVDVGPLATPSWFYSGDYEVTVTFEGFTSQPVYIPVASSAGNPDYNGVANNPTEQCGPTS